MSVAYDDIVMSRLLIMSTNTLTPGHVIYTMFHWKLTTIFDYNCHIFWSIFYNFGTVVNRNEYSTMQAQTVSFQPLGP